jgi:hypothetical protein
MTVEKRMWGNSWTGDEPWIMWISPQIGSWMTIEGELPQRGPQTIRATESMLTVFFTPKEFAPVNLLQQERSFAMHTLSTA